MQPKLHLSHLRRDGRYLPRIRLIYVIVRRIQVDAVEGIVVFLAKLDRLSLGDGKDLTQRQIHEEGSRTDKGVPSSIPVAIEALRGGEGRWIKPLSAILICDVRVADFIRPHGIEVRVQQRCVTDIRRKRRAGSDCSDAAEFPTPGYKISHTIHICAKALPPPERQLPNIGYGKLVSSIETGRAIIRLAVEIVARDSSQFSVIECLGIGIGHYEVEPVRLVLNPLQLQGVVIVIIAVAYTKDALGETELLVEASPWIKISGSGRSLVEVGVDIDMAADVPNICRFDRHGRRDLMLDCGIPELR